MDVWQNLFNFGVPTAILLILLWGIWKIITWAKLVVVEPVVGSHLKLIDSLNEHLPKQTSSIEKLVKESETQTKESKIQTGLIVANDQAAILKEQNNTLLKISENTHATTERVSKWPSDLVNKVADTVMERIKKELQTQGCSLTDRELELLLRSRAAAKAKEEGATSHVLRHLA